MGIAYQDWAFERVASGASLGAMRMPWPVAAAIVSGFEVVESALRRLETGRGRWFRRENWAEIVADVLVGMGAYLLGRWMRSDSEGAGRERGVRRPF